MVNESKPLVAIVGRPNVGKSTLFNRLSGARSAIVSDTPGTTRDRITTETEWGNCNFILVDTGGITLGDDDEIWQKIREQVVQAINFADVIVFTVDAETGIAPADGEVADILRKTDTPVIIAANKSDNAQRELAATEFYSLGLGEPTPISAYHNSGIDDLMTRVLARFPSKSEHPTPEADLSLSIVGRANVGKSTLVNRITGQDRAIVSDVPGTTRDALDTLIKYENRSVLLIDTAGIRRRGKVEQGLEHYSVLRSIRAIDRARVSILLLDATELATSQDTHIASHILDAYKAMVIVVNKWDKAPDLDITKQEAMEIVTSRFKFASYTPICFISGILGTGIKEVMSTAYDVQHEWQKGLPRYELRRVILEAVAAHPPSPTGKRSLKIYGVTQDTKGPPSFTFYVNRTDMVHFSYQRYLENAIRKMYGFKGSRLRMRFKGRGDS
ncbi:MAG: ribosome biogenesis GTPase Der [SAR202 cluster bacterium]|nr:ribosome biogenesis GTPase Der [SAR202 cluster bacterium]